MTHHLLGVAEIATMLGVSRQRVNQLVQADGFPAPEIELSAGRVWARSVIEAWVAQHAERGPATDASTFARFSDAAREVVVRAQEEARRLQHGYIGGEHLLLALSSAAGAAVQRQLTALGLTHDAIEDLIVARYPAGSVTPIGQIPFTPKAAAILEHAAALAADGPVEPRHELTAVVDRGDGVAAHLLRTALGVDQAELVATIERTAAAPPRMPFGEPAASGACSFCGKTRADGGTMVAGHGVLICDACVSIASQIVTAELGDDLAVLDRERDELATRIGHLSDALDELRRELEERGSEG